MKNLSFKTVLVLIGSVFFLVGITGGFTVSGYALQASAVVPRIVLGIVGTMLVSLAVVAELSRKRAGATPAALATSAAAVTADQFFFTLDDRPSSAFPSMVKEAIRISILGRTAVNLLGQYQRVFEELARGGCTIRLLFVNPDSAACAFLYGSNLAEYRRNAATSNAHLERLSGILRHSLQVRLMDGAPTVSIILVERADHGQSFAHVQLYFLHGAVGRDRPAFQVSRNEKWYGVFSNEFERLWDSAAPWTALEST